MTLPLLLLGLYLSLLVLAISLASWAGHSSPAPEEARRVTDAAERAGLSHLSIPAKVALGANFVFACGAGALAILRGLPTAWLVIAPLVAPLLLGAALFYCVRKLLRASGQLLGAVSADGRIVLTSRTVVAAVLCCEATVGLILLGVHSLAVRELGASTARLVILLVGSSIALAAIVFARAAASAHYAVARGAEAPLEQPHAGSLAMLVSSSFHAPLLRLISLILISTLGHCALLAFAHTSDEESQAALWLYPHLLRVLGLFGLLFAGMVARTSEDESGSEGWIRGALVYLVLMVAGAWSLSSELPVGWARTVPAGLSFLYVSLGLSVWLAGSDPQHNPAETWGTQAARKLSPSFLFWGLVIVLLLTTVLTKQDPALPQTALLSLMLAGTLAAIPLSGVWLLARDLAGSTTQARKLAFVGETYRGPSTSSPSVRLLSVLPHLCLVVALCSVSGLIQAEETVTRLEFLLFGIGAAVGALLLATLAGLLEIACRKAISGIRTLVREHHEGEAAPLNFELAVVMARDAIGKSDIYWILLALVPTAVALVALPYLPTTIFRALILGLSIGGVVLGIGVELLLNSHQNGAQRTLANLCFAACLAQALWLLAAGASLA